MTPMEFARERRFDLVRRELLEGAPGTTVTNVGASLGSSACSESEFPSPCDSTVEPSHIDGSYLYAGDGSAVWRLVGGWEADDLGNRLAYCGVIAIGSEVCSGSTTAALPVTLAEASACQAEIPSWAQQKGLTCH
ncbi:hypothetical protein [Sorangium sp. So ce1097]|uniref:hypothetical protein n=1 Tax=Sorangium sp. So ce1097 TaxID=3133330 RepID=UPI003F621FD0